MLELECVTDVPLGDLSADSCGTHLAVGSSLSAYIQCSDIVAVSVAEVPEARIKSTHIGFASGGILIAWSKEGPGLISDIASRMLRISGVELHEDPLTTTVFPHRITQSTTSGKCLRYIVLVYEHESMSYAMKTGSLLGLYHPTAC